MRQFKIAIIGYGNIGKKRHKSLKTMDDKNTIVSSIFDKKFKKIKKIGKTTYFNNINNFDFKNIDLIIISTPTNESKNFITKFIGKYNLLVEKPISRDLNFVKKITEYSTKSKKVLKTGYNLRYDDGILLAKKLFDKKLIGKVYYIKNIYANGAARTNTNKVGSLLDMGSHSLNLLQYFFKKIKIINVKNQKNEFMKKKYIDNGFITMQVDKAICLIHHGFCTWKNNFEFEISGSKGFIKIISLSKWGDQKIIFGKRTYPSGIPKIKEWIFKVDNSWKNELLLVIKKIREKRIDYKLLNIEGYDTLKLIKKVENEI